MDKTIHPALDGLRAMAVTIVLIAHTHLALLPSGAVGVDIFFVLSGFLITTVLSAEMGQRGTLSTRNFYIRRILRLAPCLILATAVFAVLARIETGSWPLMQLAIALTHTSNWARALYDAPLGAIDHYWSLAIEEQYYLVWPLIVLWLERSMRDTTRKGLVLVACALALALYRAVMVGTYSPERIYFGLDTHMDGLVLGSGLSYLVKSGIYRRSAMLNGKALALLVVPACIVLLLILCYVNWRSPWMGRFGFAAAAVAAALIVYDLVAGPASWLRSPLSLPPVTYIGRISYGLYLFHMPLFQAVDYALPDTSLRLRAPFKIILAVAVASASYYGVERRFLKLKQRFAPRARSDDAADSLRARA